VIIADAVFTATAVVVQPVTGAALAWVMGLFAGRALDRRLVRVWGKGAKTREELARLMIDEFHIIEKQEIPVEYQEVA